MRRRPSTESHLVALTSNAEAKGKLVGKDNPSIEATPPASIQALGDHSQSTACSFHFSAISSAISKTRSLLEDHAGQPAGSLATLKHLRPGGLPMWTGHTSRVQRCLLSRPTAAQCFSGVGLEGGVQLDRNDNTSKLSLRR